MVLLARDESMFCSTAAIVPCVMATSRMAEMPFLASMTCPPLSSRSYWVCAPSEDARIRRTIGRMALVLDSCVRRASKMARATGDNQFRTGHDGHGTRNGLRARPRIKILNGGNDSKHLLHYRCAWAVVQQPLSCDTSPLAVRSTAQFGKEPRP